MYLFRKTYQYAEKCKVKDKKNLKKEKTSSYDGDILENSVGRDVPIVLHEKAGLICLFLVGILCIVLFKGNRGIVAYLKRHRSNAVLVNDLCAISL